MKQLLSFLFVLILLMGLSFQAHAELFNRGTDTLGNRLIYDSDLNITWYDYSSFGAWQSVVTWASNLTVTFGGNVYDDWRLPATVDAPSSDGYYGYYITSSEKGHLFYTELGNNGLNDTSGNPTGLCSTISPYCLTNTSPFQHLKAYHYWSGTVNSDNPWYAWQFSFKHGWQELTIGGNYDALAVRAGDVAVAPEPISSILFLTGGATFIGRIYLRRKRIEV